MTRAGSRTSERLRLGILKLTDSAPVVIAHELGLFAAEGIDVTISVEPSWANIADKLVYHVLDGAVMTPPLALAISLGLRGREPCPLVVPMSLSLGGNTVTLSAALAAALPRGAADDGALATAKALAALPARRRSGGALTLAVVHVFSTHHLLLRYWLAAAGIDPDRDLNLTVVPPARVVEAISQGRIDGFCAGAPWGHVTERTGLGVTVATSHDIWRNSPEKVFAVRGIWAERHPETVQALLRALLRAAQLCDDPARAGEIAAILSREKYLGMPAELLLSSLPGRGARQGRTESVFFANAATFPWRSHALWALQEMARWRLVGSDLDAAAVARSLYRPDLYAVAAREIGASVPIADNKSEGTHEGAWIIDARPAAILMGPDLFCDGRAFDPASPSLRVAAP
jgi:ABC-type nitrate/sulfonate/bicarbonate transport system substrate-binding protein